jgi:hypothetical protein
MQNGDDPRPSWDDGPPIWRPQPGEVLAGVINQYSISQTPRGLVRTVIVTEARTGEQVSLQLASTSLLALFAQHQPHPGEWIDVRYRWKAPDQTYQRWWLLMDRPETLDFSPLGGEASDEASWHHKRRGAVAFAGSTDEPYTLTVPLRRPGPGLQPRPVDPAIGSDAVGSTRRRETTRLTS